MATAKKKAARRRTRLDRTAQQKREVAIISDIKAGQLSYRMIAQKHGVSLPTVNAKARKAGVRRPRGRRPAGAKAVAVTAIPRMAVKTRRTGRRTPRTTAVGRPVGATGFDQAFREMVLQYFPTITLARFDRLVKIVRQAMD